MISYNLKKALQSSINEELEYWNISYTNLLFIASLSFLKYFSLTIYTCSGFFN